MSNSNLPWALFNLGQRDLGDNHNHVWRLSYRSRWEIRRRCHSWGQGKENKVHCWLQRFTRVPSQRNRESGSWTSQKDGYKTFGRHPKGNAQFFLEIRVRFKENDKKLLSSGCWWIWYYFLCKKREWYSISEPRCRNIKPVQGYCQTLAIADFS